MTTQSDRHIAADALRTALKETPKDIPPRDQKVRCLITRDTWTPHLEPADRRRVVRYWDDEKWTAQGALHQVEVIERRASLTATKRTPEVA